MDDKDHYDDGNYDDDDDDHHRLSLSLSPYIAHSPYPPPSNQPQARRVSTDARTKVILPSKLPLSTVQVTMSTAPLEVNAALGPAPNSKPALRILPGSK